MKRWKKLEEGENEGLWKRIEGSRGGGEGMVGSKTGIEGGRGEP